MFRPSRRALPLAVAALAVSGVPLAAQETRLGDLVIQQPWTRAVGERAQAAAGYLVIRNAGSAPDRLIAAATPRARVVELHEMAMTDGVMRMRPIAGGIALPPGREVRLAPGGLHLMLIGPQGGFVQGTRVPVTLTFERAGQVTVELSVEAAGARAPGAHHGH
jgi:periplasmic copper chaperone A